MITLCGNDPQYCQCTGGVHNQAELDGKLAPIKAALTMAKPIVGAATASASNAMRPLRQKAYDKIEKALSTL